MRYHDLIEGRDAPLFHFMYFEKLVPTLENDKMEARWEHIINGSAVLGNSFSRNKRLSLGRLARLTFDQTLLSQTNKIVPLDGEAVFSAGYMSKQSPRHAKKSDIDRIWNKSNLLLSEEFVIGDIKRLHRYVTKIDIGFSAAYSLSSNETIVTYDIVTAYGKEHNIEVRFADSFMRAYQFNIDLQNDPDY